MKIHATNFLGVKDVTIPLHDQPMAILGENAVGKSSLAVSVSGLLTADANPLGLGSTKKPYVRDGERDGEVLLTDDQGTQLARWILSEAAIRVFHEQHTRQLPHTVGLVDFIRAKPAERTAYWEEIFLPSPEELVKRISDDLKVKIGRDSIVNDVVENLRSLSWKQAESVYRQKALKQRRAWQAITGENYGTRKGATWEPSDWTSALDGLTVHDAQEELNMAESIQTQSEIKRAITEGERDKALEAERELPAAKKKLDRAQTILDETDAILKKLNHKRDEMRRNGLAFRDKVDDKKAAKPRKENTSRCPECDAPLLVQIHTGGTFTLHQSTDPDVFLDQVQEWQNELDEMEKELVEMRAKSRLFKRDELFPIEKRRQREWTERNHWRAEVQTLERIIADGTGHVPTAEDDERVAEAKLNVEKAKKGLKAVESYHAAKDAHNSYIEYKAIENALGPRGIRGTAMAQAMTDLHDVLDKFSEVTGWKNVRLDSMYSVLLDGRPALVCAASEKWQAQFCLQAAIAVLRDNPRIVADAADDLSRTNLERLVLLCNWLASQGTYAMIFCHGQGEWVPGVDWGRVTIKHGVA